MKNLINNLGLSIKEFAKVYEIPYNTVRQWYNEERTAPTYIKKMIETIIELKSNCTQLKFFDDEYQEYSNIITEYDPTAVKKTTTWNNDRFVEIRTRFDGIQIEYGNASNLTVKKLSDKEQLKKELKKLWT